jgi:hypothetical protein
MIIFIIAIVCNVILLICNIVEYQTYTDKSYPKIKFSAFKKFYSINPERWNLDIGSVVCKIVNEENKAYRGLFYTYDKERFYFGFLDYIKYKRFCKQIRKDKLNAEHMESTSKMLSMVRKDIDNMEELGRKQQEQARDNFNKILNNLGGTK